MSNVTRKIFAGRTAFAPLLMSAIMAAILIVAAGSPEATPVPKAAKASPTIAPSIQVVASVQCHGTIASSPDTAVIPNGDVDWNFGFLAGNPAAKFPAKGKTNSVNGVFSFEVSGACNGLNTVSGATPLPPCAQGGQFTGTIAPPPTTSATSPGTMSINFTDFTGVFASEGKDVLDGCQATFAVLPFGSNKSANLITTATLALAPAPNTTPCKAAGTSVVLGCLSHNE